MTELEAVQNEYNKLGLQKNLATKAKNFWGFTFLGKLYTDPAGITNGKCSQMLYFCVENSQYMFWISWINNFFQIYETFSISNKNTRKENAGRQNAKRKEEY